MTKAFVPKHYSRTKLASGRVLSDAQQYQYDVLRSVDGKLVRGRDAWYREVPYIDVEQQRGMIREKIYGLNVTAMFKLVELGLVECVLDAATGGYQFLLPELAKGVPGPRYRQVNQIIKAQS